MNNYSAKLASSKEIDFNLISLNSKRFKKPFNLSNFEVQVKGAPNNKYPISKTAIQTIRIFIDKHQFLESKNVHSGYKIPVIEKCNNSLGVSISPVKSGQNFKKSNNYSSNVKNLNKIDKNLNMNIISTKKEIEKYKQDLIQKFKKEGLINNNSKANSKEKTEKNKPSTKIQKKIKFDNLKKFHVSTISVLPIYPNIKRIEIDLDSSMKTKSASNNYNVNMVNETTNEKLIKPIINRWNYNNRIYRDELLLKNTVNYKDIVNNFNLNQAVPNQDAYYLVKQKDNTLIKSLIRPTQYMDYENVIRKFKENDQGSKGSNNSSNSSSKNCPFFILKKEDIEDMLKEINFGKIDYQKLKDEYTKINENNCISYNEKLIISRQDNIIIESEKMHLKNVLKTELEKNILQNNIEENPNEEKEECYVVTENNLLKNKGNISYKNPRKAKNFYSEKIENFSMLGEPNIKIKNIYTFKQNSDELSYKENYDSNREFNDFGQTTPIGLLTEKYFLYGISKWAKYSYPEKQESFQTLSTNESVSSMKNNMGSNMNEIVFGISNFSLSIERIKMKVRSKKMYNDIGIINSSNSINNSGIDNYNNVILKKSLKSTSTKMNNNDINNNNLYTKNSNNSNNTNNNNVGPHYSRKRMNEKSSEILKRNVKSKSKPKTKVVRTNLKSNKEEEKSL